jgi:ABC-type multidrug transport system fused ATPase/permease subunit
MLSDFVGRTLFRLFRSGAPALSLAGPLSLVLVILCWAFLQALGFALIYWAAFPAQFQFNNTHASLHGFWLMLYFSLQAMTTVGLGDVTPKTDWLRILVAFQALAGLALVTASVSWIVLLYPALGRMRTLARHVSILARAEQKTSVAVVSGEAQFLLGDLASDVIRTRVDLIHFPIIYYFYSGHARSSLAELLPHLVRFALLGSNPERPERVRLASAALREALNDLAEVLAERLRRADTKDPEAVFRAYAEEHLAYADRG